MSPPPRPGLLRRLARAALALAALPWLWLLARPGRARDELVWGPVPVMNNKYWSAAMRAAGWRSTTLMMECFTWINRREDFDLYFEDLVPRWLPRALRAALGPYAAAAYVLRRAAVVHVPFSGGPLGTTPLWALEPRLLRRAGVRSVVLPYGGDLYMYARIADPSVRHGMLASYPGGARREAETTARVELWVREADAIVTGFLLDGLGRWDCLVGNMCAIDTARWRPRMAYSPHDGVSGPVVVAHTPNHRGVKGTEFLRQAVANLRAEGLQVELALMEGLPNEVVRARMQEADILADQFLLPGYGLAAIEGMASGLPVMANLEDPALTRVFRRFSFLDECPILSTSPETLHAQLRALVTDPDLRARLGRAGRQYAAKYHGFEAAAYLFGTVYERILDGRPVDILHPYHPLTSAYVRKSPRVDHPLCENLLPSRGAPPVRRV